jgi:hypothetical protein
MTRGVKIQELRIGEGEVAGRDTIATVRYEGTLRRGERFGGGMQEIDLRRRETIAGLRYGIEGMRVCGPFLQQQAGTRDLTVSQQTSRACYHTPGINLKRTR